MKNLSFRMVLIGFVMLVLSASALAQGEIIPGDVAILVVDIFEGGVDVFEPEAGDPQCILSVDGQDSFKLQGNSGGLVNPIVSSLYPFAKPHGRFVYQYFQEMLAGEQGGALAPTSADSSNLRVQLGHEDVEFWQVASGGIWLVAVPTNGAALPEITDRINSTLDELQNIGVTRFVINMSFGLVPCSAMPVVSVADYLARLSAWGVQADCSIDGLPTLACKLSDPNFTESLIENLVALRDTGGPTALAFSTLHLALVRPQVMAALAAVVPGGDEEQEIYFDAQYDVAIGHSDLRIIRVASAGNDNLTHPYFPAILRDVLSVSAEYPPSICSQGSRSEVYDYLQGQLGFPSMAVDEFIHYVLSPVSNYGEVRENGISSIEPSEYLTVNDPAADVLGCLTGTSFAAPRVSVQMALYLMQGKPSACEYMDSAGNQKSSEPPLAHELWDNLSVPAASSQYCANFP